MKANGKNLMMFTYETHHYMDMYPETEFRTAESQAVVNDIINNLRLNWSGGSVTDAKPVTPQEYYKARQSRYWKGYEEALDKLALDCTQEWLDEYNGLIERDVEIQTAQVETNLGM